MPLTASLVYCDMEGKPIRVRDGKLIRGCTAAAVVHGNCVATATGSDENCRSPLSLHCHKATGRVGRTSGASAFVPLVVERLVGSLAADWLAQHSTAPACLPRLVVTLTEDII